VNLASLIEQLGSEIPLLTGGGHPEAAAFASREDTFFLAIRKIRDLLNESAIGR
jgi:hypothetical protein